MSTGEPDNLEIAALLAARAELGPAYDAALVDSFAARVERLVEARAADRQLASHQRDSAIRRQFVLGVLSVVAGVVATATSLVQADGVVSLVALILCWSGLGVINLAYLWRGWR